MSEYESFGLDESTNDPADNPNTKNQRMVSDLKTNDPFLVIESP